MIHKTFFLLFIRVINKKKYSFGKDEEGCLWSMTNNGCDLIANVIYRYHNSSVTVAVLVWS